MKRLLLLAVLIPSFSYSMDFSNIIAEEAASGGQTFRTAFEGLRSVGEATASSPGFIDPFAPAKSSTPWGMIIGGASLSWSAYCAYKNKVKTDTANREANEKVAKTKADCDVEVQQINLANAIEKRRLLAEAAEARLLIAKETEAFRQQQLSLVARMAEQHNKDEASLLRMLLEVEKARTDKSEEETEAAPEVVESPIIYNNQYEIPISHHSTIHFS